MTFPLFFFLPETTVPIVGQLAKLRADCQSARAAVGNRRAGFHPAPHRGPSRYGAFTVSGSKSDDVRKYIASQEARHRRVSFQEEFLTLLKKHGLEYDARSVWGLGCYAPERGYPKLEGPVPDGLRPGLSGAPDGAWIVRAQDRRDATRRRRGSGTHKLQARAARAKSRRPTACRPSASIAGGLQ